ncbi:MAG: hypothetical protein Q9163_000465 [Psora crenata]
MFLSRRCSPLTAAASLAGLILLIWLFFTSQGQVRSGEARRRIWANLHKQHSLRSVVKKGPVSHFHLLVPASSSNENLCRLLFSAVVLNYPPPILVNWGATETDNVFAMHMGKIGKVLAYLEHFSKEQEDDLVLMVDGYDIWFQLPPEVLIKRYHEVIDAQNDRIKSAFAPKVIKDNDLRQTILFGPDKVCWPDEPGGRPACWAVPQSTLPKYAFGPYDDTDVASAKQVPYQARPRWLNSGSIMGPVKDVRPLFEAVAARVRDHYHGDSDQYYFATLWGFQEYARLQYASNATIPTDVTQPDLEKEVGNSPKIEFHVSLDYESSIFQPVGYYDPYLTWVRYDGSIQAGRPNYSPIPHLDVFELEGDIKVARPPLAAMEPLGEHRLNDLDKAKFNNTDNTRLKRWPEIPLFTNIITKHVPPLLHFMMEKPYRIKWWDRMWYAPFARELFLASATAVGIPIFTKPLNGRMFANADVPVIEHEAESTQGRRDGAWSDKGEWLPWNILCEAHDEYVFGADQGPAVHNHD